MRAHVAAALLALLSLDPAPRASAQDAGERVVVLLRGGPELWPPLRAELGTLGFDALVIMDADELEPSELSARARAHEAAAAIALHRGPERTEVWVADRITGKVLYRRLADDDLPPLVALRVVELLRASLLELQLGTPPSAEVTPSEPVRRSVRPPSPLGGMALELGAGVEGAPSATVSGSVRVGFRWTFAPPFGLALRLDLPVAPAVVSAEEGTANVFIGRLLLSLGLELTDAGSPVTSSVELGCALAYDVVDASARPGLVANDASAWDVQPAIAASFAGRLGPFELGVTAFGAVSVLPVSVQFAGREVASFGPVTLGATAFVAWTFEPFARGP